MSRARLNRQVARFSHWCDLGEADLVDRFGRTSAGAMRAQMIEEFRDLASQVPRIGPDGSPSAGNLLAAYSGLAVYRVVQRHGGSVEDAAKVLRTVVRAQLQGLPRVARAAAAWYWFSGLNRWRWTRGARRSLARRYPNDWVVEMVPANDTGFDFGFDMTECGNVSYLHAHGADELTPYICALDYDGAELFGYGLQRTKTLALGCDRCDFRYSRHGHVETSWPPQFAERGCGQPHVPPKE
ncbi:MAG: L-2-amino-thiazoline-4-carboxylic acid hydrolase [Propionibacteriaceae bacterium]|nr:L-2-amino-thiazoline-4-carboxylic acid hydrolase [Propionibacteriaceae bacterium]